MLVVKIRLLVQHKLFKSKIIHHMCRTMFNHLLSKHFIVYLLSILKVNSTGYLPETSNDVSKKVAINF